MDWKKIFYEEHYLAKTGYADFTLTVRPSALSEFPHHGGRHVRLNVVTGKGGGKMTSSPIAEWYAERNEDVMKRAEMYIDMYLKEEI